MLDLLGAPPRRRAPVTAGCCWSRVRPGSARPPSSAGSASSGPSRGQRSSGAPVIRSSRPGRSDRSSRSPPSWAGDLADAVETGAGPHRIVSALLGAAPAIVVLEDLHWADEATLDVVRLLARRVEAARHAGHRDLPRRRTRSHASAAPRPGRDRHPAGGHPRHRRAPLPDAVAELAGPAGSMRPGSTGRPRATRSS